jgi:hypothetical protein
MWRSAFVFASEKPKPLQPLPSTAAPNLAGCGAILLQGANATDFCSKHQKRTRDDFYQAASNMAVQGERSPLGGDWSLFKR